MDETVEVDREGRAFAKWVGEQHHQWVMSLPDEPQLHDRPTQATVDNEPETPSDYSLFHHDAHDSPDDPFWTAVRERQQAKKEQRSEPEDQR
jgi:hypothetical protein